MNIKHIAAALAVGVAFAFLCSLGVWQVKRLHWKEAMIARVQAGLKQPPVSLAEIEQALSAGQDIEYRPVTVQGTFLHDAESHYFATHEGKPGYFIYTPLKLADGRVLIVNRGYVPMDRKQAATRAAGQLRGTVTINGLARSAPKDKPNSFTPDNDPADNVFYWKSLAGMAAKLSENEATEVVSVFVDAGSEPVAGGPVGGVTRVTFPNSHLQYAITWFGLAAALLGVSAAFVWRTRQGRLNHE